MLHGIARLLGSEKTVRCESRLKLLDRESVEQLQKYDEKVLCVIIKLFGKEITV